MRRSLTIPIVILIILTVIASSAFSQNAQLLGIRALLERTDDIIAQAQHVVASTSYTGSRIALEAAVTLQGSAWERYYEATSTTGQAQSILLAQAKKLSLDARTQAENAIAATHVTEQSETVLQRKLEYLSELVGQVGGSFGHGSNSLRGSVMESVRSTQERDWEFYRDGQYRLSLSLCNQVEQTVRKMINAGNNAQRDENHYERRSDFVRRGIERVEGQLTDCASPAAPALLEQAREALERADQMVSDGQPGMALKALQNARKLTEEAARKCRGQQNLANRYDQLLSETERRGEQVEPGDDHGRELLRLIYEQLELTTGYLESNNSASAAAALKAASLSLAQLKRHLNDSGI